MVRAIPVTLLLFAVSVFVAPAVYAQDAEAVEYRLLATNKTATMEKELNDAANTGFRFERAMGGDSAFGGSEVIAVVSRERDAARGPRYEYKLLATNKTSTMQKELQDAGDAGFEYRDQTVFKTSFGGEEVVVILERDREAQPTRYEYRLLGTNRTSTMQKELQAAGDAGFRLVGVTVAKSMFGGNEVITILRRGTLQ